MKIQVLDPITANQIAAGEVVERPASVVKELVENAIDAGSTKIEIELKDGIIRVTDNGSGMSQEDAVLAFERHATSKIRTLDDLHMVASLGFRGEALPSIASVAKVELTTRPADSLTGSRVVFEGGILLENEPVGCSPGTTVVVRDLFFNTPARQKHLKTPGTENGLIGETVANLMLAYPHVAFSFLQDGRVSMQSPGSGQLLDTIAALRGLQIAREMIPIAAAEDFFELEGFLGKPSLSRSTRNQQVLFVNGRHVRNRLVSQAVEEAYHTLLMTGRHPVFILHLRTNPHLVDVNVHPTKMEVRFSEESALRDFVYRQAESVIQAWENASSVVPQVFVNPNQARGPHVGQGQGIVQSQGAVRDRNREYGQDKVIGRDAAPGLYAAHGLDMAPALNAPPNPDMPRGGAGAPDRELPRSHAEAPDRDRSPDLQQLSWRPQLPEKFVHENADFNFSKVIAKTPNTMDLDFGSLLILGQLSASYIIAVSEEDLLVFDQHAVHERIQYERLLAAAEQGSEGDEGLSQDLLVPLNTDLGPVEAELVTANILLFRNLGFVLEHFGGNAFLIRSAPRGLTPGEAGQMFHDLLDHLREGNRQKLDRVKIREEFLITHACKTAIKAHQNLTKPAMEELLHQLSQTANPFTCPHGRPTLLRYTGADLVKLFKRT